MTNQKHFNTYKEGLDLEVPRKYWMEHGRGVSAEDQTSDGRMDICLKVPDAIYIIELKYGKTAEEAVNQIIEKNYAVRFTADSRPVWAIGMNISQDYSTIDGCKIVKAK